MSASDEDDDLSMADLIRVANGQAREMEDAEDAVRQLEDDQEMEELRRKARALLGEEADAEVLPLAELAPAPVVVSDLPSWEVVAERHQHASADIGDLLTPEMRAEIEREWEAGLLEIQERIDAERMAAVIRSAKTRVIAAVAGPFGLGAIVAKFDHRGGNVLTAHNAIAEADGPHAGELADQQKLAKFRAERAQKAGRPGGVEYDRKDYDKGFPKRRKEMFKAESTITDGYTGKELPKDGRMHLDHVVSAKEIHDDDNLTFHLGADGKKELATAPENVVPTDSGLNQSKGEQPLLEFADKTRKDGSTNRERFELDDERMRSRDDAARSHIREKRDAAALEYYAKETLKGSVKDAARMGLQQALGLVLAELASAIFDEVADIYRNGMSSAVDQSFMQSLGQRLRRVADRVVAQWRAFLEALAGGAVSGAISNLVTAAINLFVTTSKRLVRIIREGIFSLLSAVRILLSPPEGMTLDRAAHEASKLIAAGLAVSGGVILEEAVEKAIASVALLAPVAPFISAVLAGIVTGLVTVLAVHWLDTADLFGTVENERQHKILDALDARLQSSLDELEASIGSDDPVRA